MASLSWSVLMLLLVLALIPASLWVVKRVQQIQPAGGARALEMLAQLPLGPRERIAAVRVGRRVLVLGVTGQQVSLLADLDNGMDDFAPAEPRDPGFASVLQSFTQRPGYWKKP